jgi:hypothetical protein
MDLIPRDTTLEAARVQEDIFRRMHPNRRLEIAFALSRSVRGIAASGVRSRHPEYSEQQVRWAVAKLVLGAELFRKAYPEVSIEV